MACSCLAFLQSSIALAKEKYVFKAGSPTLKAWLLPKTPPYPKDNKPTKARIHLGKMIYFDPRLSKNGNMSCATCHNPGLGWSDAVGTAVGHNGKILGRASPTVINTAYNSIQMWDGRIKTLEQQALGPIASPDEMNSNVEAVVKFLKAIPGYRKAFEKAYPGQPINAKTLGDAVASFERIVTVTNTPFDKWVKGDKKAMSPAAIRGFKLFVGKARCDLCHMAPNFTDDGFHNIGIVSKVNKDGADMGRYNIKAVRINKGAFKTPTLRNIALHAPYFHDGSAKTLLQVVEHYNNGGEGAENLSPNMHKLHLTMAEMKDLVAFMNALTSKTEPKLVTLPKLPQMPQTA